MGKISEKAKFIDMYASLPALSFGKDGKVYSRFGLLLTFLTIFIIGGMAIWIGIKIFGRQTPSFIQYELPPQELNPKIQWDTDDFKFGLSTLIDEQFEEKLLFIGIDYKDASTNKWINVDTTKCKFAIAGDSNFHCFEQDESTKGKTYLDAKGTWSFKAQYHYCTSWSQCETEADIKAYLEAQSVSAYFIYHDLLIDPFNYENPLTQIESYVNELVLLKIGTTLLVELNEIEFTSDNGWIFEDLNTVKMYKPTISLKVSDETMLGVHIIYGGGKTVYKRTYPKIQDFFAQISGFITIITPIFLILVSPYGNLQAIQHMTNEIYEIKLNKPNNNGGDSPQKPAAKKKRRSSKSKVSPILAKETEGDLLPQKTMVKSKTRGQSLSTNRTKTLTSPHAAFVIGGFGKLPTKELPAPKETSTTFHFDTFDKSPSKISPDNDHSNLISPQKPFVEHTKLFSQERQKLEDGKLDENLDTIEAKDLENSDVDDQNPDEGVSDCETDIPLRTSDPLQVPWQAWLKSFWRPNPEVQVLKKAQQHLMEAFDLVTLSKKIIEIDKLKACLFTHDQRVIFENLPSSVIVLNPDIDIKSPEAIKQYHWKDSFKGDEVAVRKAYARLQGTKNELDQLLIRLYESEYIDDGASL